MEQDLEKKLDRIEERLEDISGSIRFLCIVCILYFVWIGLDTIAIKYDVKEIKEQRMKINE